MQPVFKSVIIKCYIVTIVSVSLYLVILLLRFQRRCWINYANKHPCICKSPTMQICKWVHYAYANHKQCICKWAYYAYANELIYADNMQMSLLFTYANSQYFHRCDAVSRARGQYRAGRKDGAGHGTRHWCDWWRIRPSPKGIQQLWTISIKKTLKVQILFMNIIWHFL